MHFSLIWKLFMHFSTYLEIVYVFFNKGKHAPKYTTENIPQKKENFPQKNLLEWTEFHERILVRSP